MYTYLSILQKNNFVNIMNNILIHFFEKSDNDED